MKPFDLIVIGSGPAGQRGAIQAAKLGKRVALIEKEPVFGGACIHTGTLPSKALRESIYNIYTFRLGSTDVARDSVRDRVSMNELFARKNKVVTNENDIVSHEIRSNGISVYHGHAAFVDPHSIEVRTSEGGEVTLHGSHFLIATGSRPVRPPNMTFNDRICDSDSILELKEIPESMTVIGGGVIGCEYASMFAALGVKVHLVDKKSDILPFIDLEITEVLKKALISQGCSLHLGSEFAKIGCNGANEVETTLKNGEVIKTQVLLYAMGRGPQTATLNLPAINIKMDPRGHILVDKNYVSSQPHIYAVGDVIGFPSLASSSFEQGRLAICAAFKVPHAEFPETFPYGIYTIPEISSVGKTEEQLIEEGVKYETGRAEYQETARGQIIADSMGLLKICFCPSTYKIFGIHIIGNSSSELIHLGQMVMLMGGDIRTLVRNIFNYPTLAEAYKIAAFNGLNKTFKTGTIGF